MSKFHSGIKAEDIREILKGKDVHIHFIGVGGVGMYPLFELSRSLGYSVSGSDVNESRLFKLAASACEKVSLGHGREISEGTKLAVYSLAVSEDDPELRDAERRGIPTASRAEYLGALMLGYKSRTGVSGTHGKSTTAAMLDAIFSRAGTEPTTVIGASLPSTGSPLRIGRREHLIYEACEYKDSFLHFSPTSSVFLNLEYDHADYFENIGALKASFLKAMNSSPLSAVNNDDANLRELLPEVRGRVATFGMYNGSDYSVRILNSKHGKYKLRFTYKKKRLFDATLCVCGEHNVMNALAAVALSAELGMDINAISSGLESFTGIERRLQHICDYNRAAVYYDYAHHPTEIECSVKTVRELTRGEVTVIFKPHTYSRTAALMQDFADALSLADRVLLSEISAIREDKIEGVSSEVLAAYIGDTAECCTDENMLLKLSEVKGGAIIIMGAADLDFIKEEIIKNGE